MTSSELIFLTLFIVISLEFKLSDANIASHFRFLFGSSTSRHSIQVGTSDVRTRKLLNGHIGSLRDILFKIKGGGSDNIIPVPEVVGNTVRQYNVLISTSIGSSFLDKKKKIQINSNSTVLDLKIAIQSKFPGSPPVESQQLFYGLRRLNDTDVMSEICTSSLTPILLDMIAGTSIYDKTMTVSEALEAYASCLTQQAYVGRKICQLFEIENSSITNSNYFETSIFREMFHTMNTTLFTTYMEDIRLALNEESNPELSSADTAAWRESGAMAARSPLATAMAREFAINLRGIKRFSYYSILLFVSEIILD